MTSLTFLGASGGSGTTTLAALSVLLLADQNSKVPTVVAENSQSFDARLGALPAHTRGSGHELVDGSRFSIQKATAAFEHGSLAIVGADTPRGLSATEAALAQIGETLGDSAKRKTVIFACATFGRPASHASEALDVIRVPFSHHLVPDAPLSMVFPELPSRTKRALRGALMPVLRETFGHS